MIDRLRGRQEWQFFRALRRAAPAYAIGWWILVFMRGALPAVASIGFGWLVSALTRGASLTAPLVMVGIAFTLVLIAQPLHQVVSANLGDRMAAHLYDRLISVCVAPPGIAHLERAELTTDLTMARDFDLGMMGPPLAISMDFISAGLVDLVVGASAVILLAGFHIWAAALLGFAWMATHWLLRESGVWKDRNTDEVRKAHRHVRGVADGYEGEAGCRLQSLDRLGDHRTKAVAVPAEVRHVADRCARVPPNGEAVDQLRELERIRGRRAARPGERHVRRKNSRNLRAGVPTGDVDDEVGAVLGVERESGCADRRDDVIGDRLAGARCVEARCRRPVRARWPHREESGRGGLRDRGVDDDRADARRR